MRLDNRGFSLLEIIIVLGIVALLTTILVPSIANKTDRYVLAATTREVASAFRYTRAKAIESRTAQSITFDLENINYQISGEDTNKLDSDIAFDIIAADKDISEDKNYVVIRFYPDGSSTGGRVNLLYKDDARGVDVIWMTGQIRILDEIDINE